MTNILVLGGAGYIGSQVVKALLKREYAAITYDNFSTGHRWAVLGGELVQGDLADRQKLRDLFQTYRIDAVMHFAASAIVGESMQNPRKYFRNNVINTLQLLDAMLDAGVTCLIFSSSCAVYGIPAAIPIPEDTPCEPVNPYGESKLMIEKVLRWYGASYGLRYVSLRYFNAAGADLDVELGEVHDPEPHLIPRVLQAAWGQRGRVEIYGKDYPTPDGTCLRDYIHVADLAAAHLRTLEYVLDGGRSEIFNLGTGVGCSVQEIIDLAQKTTGRKIESVVSDRRPGDPPVLVASGEKIERHLGWKPRHSSPQQIITSAWAWMKKWEATRSARQPEERAQVSG